MFDFRQVPKKKKKIVKENIFPIFDFIIKIVKES